MAARIKLINPCSLLAVLRYLHCVVSFREGNEKSYQLLRDSLDLYLTINPDNVQYLLLQARLYFHLGIWPEKVRTHKLLRKKDDIDPSTLTELLNTNSAGLNKRFFILKIF